MNDNMSNDTQPQPGLTTELQVERVKDGDTLEVSFIRRFSLRMMHQNEDNLIFQAPEKNTPEGQRAKEFLEDLLISPVSLSYESDSSLWKDITVFFPSNDPTSLMDMNSFERLLGEAWVDGQNIGKLMLDAGHAILKKR